jgi:hypothetical protein
MVQLALMAVLFVLVALPFLVNSLTDPMESAHGANVRPVRLIRRVTEDEVIAEFLKSDFHRHEFEDYHQNLREIVVAPNLEDAEENAKRRALLFIRHLSLWKEIPAGTEWYEAEIGEEDLDSIRIFPRAQWRKVAKGSFSAKDVAEGMHKRQKLLESSFVAKIGAMSEKMKEGYPDFAALILIGVSENEPLTVLDGNHRLVAAMIASPHEVNKLRFLCGLSPQMTECCWYNSNLITLFRYGRNVLTHAMRNPEAELAQLLEEPQSKAAA